MSLRLVPQPDPTLDFRNIREVRKSTFKLPLPEYDEKRMPVTVKWARPIVLEMCYPSVYLLLDAILGYDLSPEDRCYRSVIRCNDSDEPGTLERPPIVIQGSDDRVYDLVRDRNLFEGYKNMVSFVVVGGGIHSDAVEVVRQMGVFANHGFVAQPHLSHIRCLWLSVDANARFIHFDRAGAAYTEAFHILSDYGTFVRMVLNMTSRDERILGFDPSVSYTRHHGKKVDGTISMISNGIQVRYLLVSCTPHYHEKTKGVCRRGTVCLKVEKDGEVMMLKDAWRMDDSLWSAEHNLLMQARGIEGVVQILGFEEIAETTERIRGYPAYTDSSTVMCSRKTRVVMELLGTPVTFFKSEVQLLEGLRDAFVGLNELEVKANLHHRDISPNNIVFGRRGAPMGQRGKLIDLDSAVDRRSNPKLCLMGTTPFMPLPVLLRSAYDLDLPHSHVEDWMSFFFVLLSIATSMDGPSDTGLPAQVPRYGWGGSTHQAFLLDRLDFFNAHPLGLYVDRLQRYWSIATRRLVQSFYKFIREIARQKIEIGTQFPTDTDWARAFKDSRWSDFQRQRNFHYTMVLKFFDDALMELNCPDWRFPIPPSFIPPWPQPTGMQPMLPPHVPLSPDVPYLPVYPPRIPAVPPQSRLSPNPTISALDGPLQGRKRKAAQDAQNESARQVRSRAQSQSSDHWTSNIIASLEIILGHRSRFASGEPSASDSYLSSDDDSSGQSEDTRSDTIPFQQADPYTLSQLVVTDHGLLSLPS